MQYDFIPNCIFSLYLILLCFWLMPNKIGDFFNELIRESIF